MSTETTLNSQMVMEFDPLYGSIGDPAVKLYFAANQERELSALFRDFCETARNGAKMLALMTNMAVDEEDDSIPTSQSVSEAQAAIYELLELHQRFEQAATLMKTVAESEAFETLCEIEEVPE